MAEAAGRWRIHWRNALATGLVVWIVVCFARRRLHLDGLATRCREEMSGFVDRMIQNTDRTCDCMVRRVGNEFATVDYAFANGPSANEAMVRQIAESCVSESVDSRFGILSNAVDVVELLVRVVTF